MERQLVRLRNYNSGMEFGEIGTMVEYKLDGAKSSRAYSIGPL
jgi:hypothetical protein